jgi:hypothetical protein
MQILPWIKANKTGLLIATCVPILVLGAWLRNDLQRAQRWKMADELAGTTIFWGLPAASPDHTEYV